ncbi:CAP domain-containing protein [Cephalotus follicularis]|uniref:CAP domain-containing protein n=1 Tax=Cephalotus follicularis TaxID=3775 RepID=A0A1Q3BAE2_CEPFO|nr:CAP domain-containing protein [Cephalotus follicularis]
MNGLSLSRQFLTAHNFVRLKHGELPLMWDRRLARYARRWAQARESDCDLIHSNGPYGENLFWGGNDDWTPYEIVEKWAEEDRFFNVGNNLCQEGRMCGHFTQVVWRDTVRVGCGKALCNGGGVFVICSYDPPGNYENESPFGRLFNNGNGDGA